MTNKQSQLKSYKYGILAIMENMTNKKNQLPKIMKNMINKQN